MSDPSLSDIDFKNKMAWVWTTVNGSKLEILKRTYQIQNSDVL